MANEGPSSVSQQLGAMFFGTALSLIIHGITSCQLIWFIRTQSGRSGKRMIALVVFVWLAELMNCVFIFVATLDFFLLPAVTYAAKYTSPCTDWIARAQTIPSTMCTCTVDGFFVMRVWRLSEHKKLTILAVIPYLAGYGFGLAQIVRSFQERCNPNVYDDDGILVFGADSLSLFGDGVIVVTMCYMLYRRSSGFTARANTIKIVRGLILWSISTGILTWMTSVFILLSYLNFIPLGYMFYFIRGGVYSNAMLAHLNTRSRYRAMAEESIPLSSFSLGASEASSSQPVDRELQSALRLDPIAQIMSSYGN